MHIHAYNKLLVVIFAQTMILKVTKLFLNDILIGICSQSQLPDTYP